MKVRSILGAFVFITLASFIALVYFVQTKSFGSLLTKVVTDLSQRKAQAEVSIKNLELSIFPPGLELNKVTFARTKGDERISAEFGKLGFYLNLIEIEERRLSFGEIRIQDSYLRVEDASEDPPKTEIDQEVIDAIFEFSEKAPIRIDTLVVENAHLFVNHDLMELRRLKIFKKGSDLIGRFHVANIRPSADSDLSIDEVWGDIEVGRQNLEIYRLKVMQDVQTVLLKGQVKNYRLLKGSSADLKGEANIHLTDLDQLLGITNTIQMKAGFADASFDLTYQGEELQGRANVLIQNFESNIAHAEVLRGELRLTPKDIQLLSAELTKGKEHAQLLAPAMVFDLERKLILPAPLQISFRDYTLTNALRVVPELKPLYGQMNGRLTLRHDRGDFYITPQDGFQLSDVSLIVGELKPFRVLTIQSAQLKETDISVVNKEVRIGSSLTLPRSQVEVDGFINKKTIRFSILEAPFDLEDLGNIADLDIKGSGPLSLDVTGSGGDVQLHLKGKMKNFEVLGYKLGLADTEITVDLGNDNVVIHKMESNYGSTPISVTGAINYDDGDIALGINSPSTNYHEISRILAPIFSKMDFFPEDLNFSAKVDANVYGKTRLPEMKVRSMVNFSDLTLYGENVNSGSMNINLSEEVVRIENISATKGRGILLGDFNFDLRKDYLKTNLRWENLALSSFNFSRFLHLNLEGSIAGTMVGEGPNDDYTLDLKSKMVETRTQGHTFEDSDIQMAIHPKRLQGEFAFLGDLLTSQFDVSLNQKERTNFKMKFNVPEARPILIALLGQHIETQDLSGRFFAEFETAFTGEFKNIDMMGYLQEMVLTHPEFRVNYQSSEPNIIVKNNAIQKWQLDIKQPDVHVDVRGEGKFGEKVAIGQDLQFNSKLFEILFAPVLSSDGFIRTTMKVSGKADAYDLELSSRASGVNMSIQGLPFPISDLNYYLTYEERKLIIHNLKSSLESGSVAIRGDVYFDEIEAPDVNVQYSFDRAEIPVLGRSAVNVTGEGIILGNDLPYSLTGDLVLNKALIVNELNEFSSRSNAFSQIRYLPKNQESVLGKLLNLNVNVKADTPVRVNNSLMDVSLRGEVRLYGNPSRPRGEGRLFAPVNSSRIFFKNNEYTITSADINFYAKKDIANPDFDVQAATNMSNYKVYAKAYGDLERFNFDLTSDPALPRNSILSLIAFGYTDEIGSLRPEDQQSLTQMGVGSFVLDRFKISDILNKQFGVQVNVGTVFEQSEQSLLAGRTQDSGFGPGDLGRTRSATKIELKKRLDEATSLSVSSTMGGYIGSRQSMNLTYSLSRKVQLEGVYELRTAAEGEEDSINNSNSIGGDLKFRWSFK